MRCSIEEYGKQVEITGYQGAAFAKVDAFLKANRKQAKSEVAIQFFDADLIATWEHLYFAALNALQAFKTATNISKSVAVETMLYASARRQIQKSIDLIGVKPSSQNVAAVIIGSKTEEVDVALEELNAALGVQPDDAVLELTLQKKQKIRAAFQISPEEQKTATKTTPNRALVDLVVEHVALLSTQL
jgi:tRNA threonylcarbamoyladenosine modification (KEOPS) complex Cgi121 subunit